MSSSFFGITAGLLGLEAQQTAIDVTSHNVANANTAGYSRQIVQMVTTAPISAPGQGMAGAGQIGTGVVVGSIQRAHDDFVQSQVLYQNSQQSQEQGTSDMLTNISQVFNEPTSQGFGTLMSNFFSAWQSLANNPSDGSAQATVAAQGAALTNGFQQANASLMQQQTNENQLVNDSVSQINNIVQQVANLNRQITAVTAVGQSPNDLEDSRDNLVSQLSNLVGIQNTTLADGSDNITLAGGGALVQGVSSFQLQVVNSDPNNPNGPTFPMVALAQDPSAVLPVTGGTLGGAIYDRDTTIQSRINSLNTLASNVVSAVNAIQHSGFTSSGQPGISFFVPDDGSATAGSISVNPLINGDSTTNPPTVGDPSLIATAASAGTPADGSIATKVADLAENVGLDNNGNPQATTLPTEYASIISQLGVDGQQAQANVQSGELILQQLNSQQSTISGVSLNEEASNLIQYQNAYSAAARVISIIDSTVADMINQLGGS